MATKKFLDGKGKGEFFYDYKFDTLIFKTKDRDYKNSIEFQNFVIDIDTENFVTGIRIFDVSLISGISKVTLKNLIHGEFKASISNNVINIRFKFVGKLRNKIIPLFHEKQDFTQLFSAPINAKYHLQDTILTVPEITSC